VSTSHTPAVTVHVPCHDYGRYLDDALASLLAQTCTDWEAIVTDDASTDDTAAVMARHDDPRIRPVHHRENRGHLATYNEGLALATAPYFVILSADDRYHPEFLERALAVLDANPDVGLAFTDAEHIDETGEVIGIATTTLAPDVDWVREVSLEMMLHPFIPGGAVVARTAALRELGGFDADLPHSTDTYLWRRLAFRGPVAHVGGRLYQYRLHGASMHTSTSWHELMVTEESEQYRRLLADPAVPPRVVAHRGRIEATLSVHRARVAYRDREHVEMLRQLSDAVRRDPRVWEPDHPLVSFGRDYARRFRTSAS